MADELDASPHGRLMAVEAATYREVYLQTATCTREGLACRRGAGAGQVPMQPRAVARWMHGCMGSRWSVGGGAE